jgi:ubiquinone/menaquinone biosynthesis C-methylase UbiE
VFLKPFVIQSSGIESRRWLHHGNMRTALLLAASLSAMFAADPAREAGREAKWKVPAIFEALGVRAGARIADIGCGDGFLTVRLAPAVGAKGKVFAVDIDDRALGDLRSRLEASGTKNVEVVRGREADPLLPEASLDGAVVLRAYHEFSQHREMLANIRGALRPGGRLVIADVQPAAEGRSRESQVASHVLSHTLVEQDFVEAGFRVVRSIPSFARVNDRENVWLIVAEPREVRYTLRVREMPLARAAGRG